MESRVSFLGISTNRLAGLWPGLPAAWFRGSLTGLLIALGFALVLEIAVLSTAVWPLWLRPSTVAVVWFCVVLYWLIAALPSLLQGTLGNRDVLAGSQQRLDLFRKAQAEYLTGNWIEAERQLLSLLDADDSDAEVQLMLATLYRRLNRRHDAGRHLELAMEYDVRSKWNWEISQERRFLQNRRADSVDVKHVIGSSLGAGNQADAA